MRFNQGYLLKSSLVYRNFCFMKESAYVPEGRNKRGREGGLPLPPAFQYLILMICSACDSNLVIIFSI